MRPSVVQGYMPPSTPGYVSYVSSNPVPIPSIVSSSQLTRTPRSNVTTIKPITYFNATWYPDLGVTHHVTHLYTPTLGATPYTG